MWDAADVHGEDVELVMLELYKRGIRVLPDDISELVHSILLDASVFTAEAYDKLLCGRLDKGPNRAALKRCMAKGGTGAAAFQHCFVSGRFWLCRWLLQKGVNPGVGPGWRYAVEEAERRWMQMPVHARDMHGVLLKTMVAGGHATVGWDNHYQP